MIFSPTGLEGCFIIEPKVFVDNRGWFTRYFCKKEFCKIGFEKDWVQMNHSYTENIATIRGMHYQLAPFKEIKMVRCISGKIFDVVIDLRADSPTFMQWRGIELSEMNRKMLFIPEGFAHGFQTLENACELLYHHSSYYEPGAEGGVRYNDPKINISWPLPTGTISERDKNHPLLDNNFKGI